jgi:general stress protein 26
VLPDRQALGLRLKSAEHQAARRFKRQATLAESFEANPFTPPHQGTFMSSDVQHPNDKSETQEARERLWQMIKDIRFSMFTTRHANGHLHARPMTTQNRSMDENASLWFFMARNSEPVIDLTADPVVNVVYANPGSDSYVSISGNAVVFEDMGLKEKLWNKMAQAWFPSGYTDPNLALVQVKIIHANYWDVQESKIVQLFQMAKAAVTGVPPKSLGEHATIHME